MLALNSQQLLVVRLRLLLLFPVLLLIVRFTRSRSASELSQHAYTVLLMLLLPLLLPPLFLLLLLVLLSVLLLTILLLRFCISASVTVPV
jgi:hypothetical protein